MPKRKATRILSPTKGNGGATWLTSLLGSKWQILGGLGGVLASYVLYKQFQPPVVQPIQQVSPIVEMSGDENWWDVIIVGAGPSGCTCAYYMLQAQPYLNILLIDSSKFPRDKTCGDQIHPQAQAILDDMGILQPLHDANAVKWVSDYTISITAHCVVDT